jgi:hypothetical protein
MNMDKIGETTKEVSATISEIEANLGKWSPEQLTQAGMKLALLNVTLGVYQVELEAQALSLETARKIEEADIFIKQKNSGSTDKLADMQSRLETQETRGEELKKFAQSKKIRAIVNYSDKLISMIQSHLKVLMSEKANISLGDK